MTVDKNINVDLARIQPNRVVKIHEGDVNSVFLVLTVTNLGASVSLTGLTIKYDAVINDYLAEQDATGTVDTTHNTIRIPVTSNMTAMSGTLRVDVRMINNTEVLYTQTINMLVERSVVQGSTIIDFSGITIVQRMNALEEAIGGLPNSYMHFQYAHEAHSSGYDADTNPVDEYSDGGVYIDNATDVKTCYIVKSANAYETPYGLLLPACANNTASHGFAQMMITSTGRFWFRYKDSNSSGGAWHPSSGWTSLTDGKLSVKEAVADTSTPGSNQVKLQNAVEPNTLYKYTPTGGYILTVTSSTVQCQYYFAEDGVLRCRTRGKENGEWVQWPSQFTTYVNGQNINKYLGPQNRGDKYFLRTCINKSKVSISKDTQILAFGDSIISTSDGGSWLTPLKDEVGCPTPYNLAVSGASFGVNAYSTSAKLMSAQLTTLSTKVTNNEIDLEDIDLIIVAAGTNDAYNNTAINGPDNTSFQPAVTAFITDLKAKFTAASLDCPPILFITPIRRGTFSNINADGEDNVEIKLAKYGAVICNIALSNGCSVINGFDIPVITDNITVKDVNNNSAVLQSFMLSTDSQHLHPNSTNGVRAYAYAVLNLIGCCVSSYTKSEIDDMIGDVETLLSQV